MRVGSRFFVARGHHRACTSGVWGGNESLAGDLHRGCHNIHGDDQLGGNTPGATVPDAMPEAAVSAETPGAPALSAAVPEASAGRWNSAWSGAWLGARGTSRTVVDGPSRNLGRFFRGKMDGLGPP